MPNEADDRTQSCDIEMDGYCNAAAINKGFVSDTEGELGILKSSPNDVSRQTINIEKPKVIPWLQRRIYIISWIRNYNRNYAISDIIAGITIGLTIIPQSIAYAALAGLPSQYGLYAAFMGAFIYVIFGTIKEVSIGPTSLMSLLTLQYTYDKPHEFAIILAFLVGLVQLTIGLLELGFLVDFISAPVTSAFTSATAVIIIGSQLKNILGVQYSSKGFVDSLMHLSTNITESKLGDGLLSIVCIVFLLSLRQITSIPIKGDTKRGAIIKKSLWYISISRNAIIVLATSAFAWWWTTSKDEPVPFRLSGKVEPGIPSFELPPFHIEYHNTTYNFLEISKELGTGIILAPLVGVLANIAIAKAFVHDAKVDASQEMLTLGLCNLFGSFFKSMPTCGAFTRSAVSQASGVKTPLAGIYSGAMVLLALGLLTPYFHFIPKATLGAVLSCAVVFMIDFKIVLRLWRESRRDLIGWFGCFFACLALGVEIGLLFGIILNVLQLLFRWARPTVEVKLKEIENIQYIYIKPNSGLYFPGVDYLSEKVTTACSSAAFQVPVVIDCNRISGLDFTSTRGFHSLAKELNKHKVILVLLNLEPKLQKFIDTSVQIYFCNKESSMKEILIQDNLRNGKLPLQEHIRASIDLGYDIEPDVNVSECGSTK